MFGFFPSPSACCASAATVYQAHFCGLSCRLAMDYGPWARCLVNRDSTALALLGTSLQNSKLRSRASTCCNPLAAPRPLYQDEPVMRYAAAITICALGAKLDDDQADETGMRKHLAGLAASCIDDAVSKAAGILHGLSFPVANVAAALQPDSDPSFQATADAFGTITAHLSTFASLGPESNRALSTIGASLGFLTHAKDACDDWESDQRRGRPNPLQAQLTHEDRLRFLAPVVSDELTQIAQSLSELPLRRHQNLITTVWIDSIQERIDAWMSMAAAPATQSKRRKAKPKKDRSNCWDSVSDSCCRECCWRGCSTCDCTPCDGDGCGCECGGCDCSC